MTLGADKCCDAASFTGERRARDFTPHVVINATVSKLGKAGKTPLDKRTIRLLGYTVSQNSGSGQKYRRRPRQFTMLSWI